MILLRQVYSAQRKEKINTCYTKYSLYVVRLSILGMAAKYSKRQQNYFKKFGLRLRKFRMKAGMTLEETEEYGLKSWKHLQRIEAGESNIRMATLLQLAKIYKVHPSELLKDL